MSQRALWSRSRQSEAWALGLLFFFFFIYLLFKTAFRGKMFFLFEKVYVLEGFLFVYVYVCCCVFFFGFLKHQ